MFDSCSSSQNSTRRKKHSLPSRPVCKRRLLGLAARPCAARQFPFFHYPVIRLVLQSRHEMHLLPSEPPKPIVIRISAIRRLVFLANRMTLSAATIAAIYKERWSIELFFKALKQSLRVKTFVGTSANALKTQIWAALIAMLLIKYLQLRSTFSWSPLEPGCAVAATTVCLPTNSKSALAFVLGPFFD